MLHTKACERLESKLLIDPHRPWQVTHRPAVTDQTPITGTTNPSITLKIPITNPRLHYWPPKQPARNATDPPSQNAETTITNFIDNTPITDPTESLIMANQNHLRYLSGRKCGDAPDTNGARAFEDPSTSGLASSTAPTDGWYCACSELPWKLRSANSQQGTDTLFWTLCSYRKGHCRQRTWPPLTVHLLESRHLESVFIPYSKEINRSLGRLVRWGRSWQWGMAFRVIFRKGTLPVEIQRYAESNSLLGETTGEEGSKSH